MLTSILCLKGNEFSAMFNNNCASFDNTVEVCTVLIFLNVLVRKNLHYLCVKYY